jgi:hypothetical protein
MDPTTITIDGVTIPVTHAFTPTRVLVAYEGLFVLADLQGGRWDLSAVPATPDEQVVLEGYLTATKDVTVMDVTKD